ncbi:MAG: ATP synthase F0 subunit A [Candidatus Amoebophilus sp. 36-38]|nr:MAG: ATP synthase F0 subunit A [Candidatus Amoebophilus sp. 36-38]
MNKHKLSFLVFISCLLFSNKAIANPEGNFVLHHIADDHEWHFATIGNTHLTLPLPIIIISKDRGLEIFSSNQFLDEKHQRTTYKGYLIDDHNKLISTDKEHTFCDLSITKSIASMMISMVILTLIVIAAAKRYKQNIYAIPRGFWGFLELIICFVRNEIAIPNIGIKMHMRFMPYLLTIFFFIWLNNLMGILPGAANVTGNISVTLVLAFFTFMMTTIYGNKYYWGHVFNPPGIPKWLLPIMIPIEVVGLFIKPISLMIRLFANITAGHIILLSIIGLIFAFQTAWAGIVTVPFGIFMFLLELMVAFLQAYIFTLLSAIYLGMAVESHD